MRCAVFEACFAAVFTHKKLHMKKIVWTYGLISGGLACIAGLFADFETPLNFVKIRYGQVNVARYSPLLFVWMQRRM